MAEILQVVPRAHLRVRVAAMDFSLKFLKFLASGDWLVSTMADAKARLDRRWPQSQMSVDAAAQIARLALTLDASVRHNFQTPLMKQARGC